MSLRVLLVAAPMIAVMWCASMLPARAQNAAAIVTGLVVDKKTALPIGGADVIGARTDGSGRFTVSNVMPGSYDISISARGCESAVNTDLILTGGTTFTLNATLVAAARRLGRCARSGAFRRPQPPRWHRPRRSRSRSTLPTSYGRGNCAWPINCARCPR